MKTNLIVCEANKGSSDKIREYCQTKGISTHLSSSIGEISQMLRGLVSPILLIELPDSSDKKEKVIQILGGLLDLHAYPIVVLGKNAHEVEQPLGNYFKMVAALRKPVSNADLFETVRYISSTFEFPPEGAIPEDSKRSPGPSFVSTEPIVTSKSNQIAPPTREVMELPEKIPDHELYGAFSSIPELFFSQLSKYEILQKDFGGAVYTTELNLSRIVDRSYFPNNPKVVTLVDQMCDKLNKWAVARLHRVASLIHRIVTTLTKESSLIEESSSAALLYSWVMATEEKTLLRKDYLTSRSKLIRKDVGSRVKDSAMKIVLELNLQSIGEIVAKVARYIAREERVGDDDLSIVASAIAAVDMVDRACWQQNHFNPRAAYKIMCMAKTGELSEFHPAVLCCIIKLLSEAIASTTQLLLIPKKVRKDPVLKEQSIKIRNQPILESEEKVEIGDLAPGMRLTRPLSTYDGRQILEEDLILDQDLIWRIWQLSLVRPLNGPAVISRNVISEDKKEVLN